MHELDDLYVRVKGLWERDPEKLEREQPLLARAFADARPREDLEGRLMVLERQLGEAEDQRIGIERALAAERGVSEQREIRLRQLKANAQREHGELKARISTLEQAQTPRFPQYEVHELDQLLAMGWYKS